MAMLNHTRRGIEALPRRFRPVFGLLLTLAVIASAPVLPAAEFGLVRFQTEQPAVTESTEGTVLSPTEPSPTLEPPHLNYAEGDIIYEEAPDGLMPFAVNHFFPDDCFHGCPPSWIFSGDVLYLNRATDSQSSLSTGFRLPDFDFDTAGRYSLSHRFDCLIGWELIYFGPFEWTQSNAAAGAGLNVLLRPVTGLNLSTFNNAVFQQQSITSRLQSYEFNQKWWGWDVITTSVGARFIDVEEELTFDTADAGGNTGNIEVLTNNHLFGGGISVELMLPVGRVSTTTRLRGSIYTNFSNTSTVIGNAGAVVVDAAEDTADFASLLEIGYHVSYYLTPRIAVRAGYDSMWLYGLALAPDQVVNLFNLGRRTVDANGDVFYHGATAGVEINW